jgi:hypothetical protein
MICLGKDHTVTSESIVGKLVNAGSLAVGKIVRAGLAAAFGLLLACLVALTVAVTQTLRGVVFAAEHVDDVAGAILEKGLETVDATVDALDGPNRHGIRGKHGQPITG